MIGDPSANAKRLIRCVRVFHILPTGYLLWLWANFWYDRSPTEKGIRKTKRYAMEVGDARNECKRSTA